MSLTALLQAARTYTTTHTETGDTIETSIPGLSLFQTQKAGLIAHPIYQPVLCIVLQGQKTVATQNRTETFAEGHSVIVTSETPVTSHITHAPYLALTLQFDMPLLRDISAALPHPIPRSTQSLFLNTPIETTILDCATRLFRLTEHPDAIPILHTALLRELYYWILSGPKGAMLQACLTPNSHTARISNAITLIRMNYTTTIPTADLAHAARMSESSFHRHFRAVTSFSPLQYQKRLRLMEAQHLIRNAGYGATEAAFAVGYESPSQFTRDYTRLYNTSPREDRKHTRAA